MGKKSRLKRGANGRLPLANAPDVGLGRVHLVAQFSKTVWASLLNASIVVVGLLAAAFITNAADVDTFEVVGASLVLFLGVFALLQAALYRIVFAEGGIERRSTLGRSRRWTYGSVTGFEIRSDLVSIRFQDGRAIKVFGKMAWPHDVVRVLHKLCPPTIADPELAKWTVRSPDCPKAPNSISFR